MGQLFPSSVWKGRGEELPRTAEPPPPPLPPSNLWSALIGFGIILV